MLTSPRGLSQWNINSCNMKTLPTPLVFTLILEIAPFQSQAAWQPGKGPLTTCLVKDVSPDHVHPEYPRPQLER